MTRSSLKEIHPTHLPLASAPAELRHLCLSENLEFHLGCPPIKQDHLRMNVAPDQTIILGPQIFLDHRSFSSIDQKNLDVTANRTLNFEAGNEI